MIVRAVSCLLAAAQIDWLSAGSGFSRSTLGTEMKTANFREGGMEVKRKSRERWWRCLERGNSALPEISPYFILNCILQT